MSAQGSCSAIDCQVACGLVDLGGGSFDCFCAKPGVGKLSVPLLSRGGVAVLAILVLLAALVWKRRRTLPRRS